MNHGEYTQVMDDLVYGKGSQLTAEEKEALESTVAWIKEATERFAAIEKCAHEAVFESDDDEAEEEETTEVVYVSRQDPLPKGKTN